MFDDYRVSAVVKFDKPFAVSTSRAVCCWCVVDRYHEDVEIDMSNEKYNFWYKHGLAMLNIHEVEMDDVGQYACVATNRLGSCTTVGELNIQGFRLL